MVKVMLGYSDPEDIVWVIRWEHGNLRGWVKYVAFRPEKMRSFAERTATCSKNLLEEFLTALPFGATADAVWLLATGPAQRRAH